MASGTGLWLRGDGTGRFAPVPVEQSGVRVHGEQRGCATSDFDQDGRADLVITQNGYETRLFRNLGSKPGLRVRLTSRRINAGLYQRALMLLSGGGDVNPASASRSPLAPTTTSGHHGRALRSRVRDRVPEGILNEIPKTSRLSEAHGVE